MKTLKLFVGILVVLSAVSSEVFAGGGHRGGQGWNRGVGHRSRVVVVQRRGGNGGLRDLGILGLGIAGGVILDRTVLRPGYPYPQRVYGPPYGLPSCADLETDVERDRCEQAQQRAADRERQRILRERLRNA